MDTQAIFGLQFLISLVHSDISCAIAFSNTHCDLYTAA